MELLATDLSARAGIMVDCVIPPSRANRQVMYVHRQGLFSLVRYIFRPYGSC